MTERGIRAGVRTLFRLPRRTPDIARADADAELDSFLAERIEYLVVRGMTPEEARAEALRRLGGPLNEVRASLRHSAERREARMGFRDTVDELLQDGRYAARGLARQPGFTAAVVLCLAIGIGANTTMFRVVDALLLRPPAGVRDPDQLLWVGAQRIETGFGGGFVSRPGISHPDYVDFGRSPALAGVAGYSTGWASFGRGGNTRRINTLTVTHTFMPLLGVRPALGRFFTADEDRAGAPAVVVLGHAFWREEFAGAADIVGRAVRIGDGVFTVVGVAPRDFNGVERRQVDVYLPPSANTAENGPFAPAERLTSRGIGWFTLVARPRPGVARERLAKELDAIYHRADGGNKRRASSTIVAAPLTATAAMPDPRQVQNATVSVWLAGVAAVVLLIACANVAGLLLTRAVRRRREIGVRLALGIGRRRLVRMLMTESLLLAAIGGAAGILIARWGGSVLRAWLLSDVAVAGSTLDARVLAVTLAATLFTGVACGLAPALHATRPDLTTALTAGERDRPEGRGRLLGAMLVGQVALTLVLLVGAGLFERSLRNLDALDLGFDARHVLIASADLPAGYTPARAEWFYRELLERARALPGVRHAALATTGPFSKTGRLRPLFVPGREPEQGLPPAFAAVTPDFFATLGTTLVSGRAFTEDDRAGSAPVAVVNDELARHHWPAGDALAKCVRVGADMAPCTTVVGVVRAARQGIFARQSIQDEAPMRGYFVPLDQQDAAAQDGPFAVGPTLYVRSAGDATALVPLVRRTIQETAPDAPPPDVTALTTALAPHLRPWRLGVTMFGVFAGVAVVLAVIGLYGVLSFRVSQRTHEIGVRIALGARRADIHRLVVGQGLRLGTLGVAIGLAAALLTGRALAALPFGVSARDPLVLAMAGGALLAVVVLASYLPARRAIRVDPMEALREL
ncbi:MAG: ABC transporter permease [Gemmatimonadaceae bacterium]